MSNDINWDRRFQDDEEDGSEKEGDSSSETEPTENDAGTSRKRSLAWLHFKPINEQQSRCRYCGKVYTNTKGATTPLLRHLKNCPQKGHEEGGM